MKVLAVIPARYQSTRLPGKPLLDIAGKPMIQWVYERALKAVDDVVVATDDERIFDAVVAFGGKAVMTRKDHLNGTSRCWEAYENLASKGDFFDFVVNIQGDEPFTDPSAIAELIRLLKVPSTEIATLSTDASLEDIDSPNAVLVTTDLRGKALYFSRSAIPFERDRKSGWFERNQYQRHIGLYGFTPKALQVTQTLPPSRLELAESLEQLRWLENGMTIRVGRIDDAGLGVDTPEDLQKAREIAASFE